jgi:transcription elongation factor GreB
MSKAFMKEDDDEADDQPTPKPLGSGPRYITPAGYLRLKAEFDELWKVRRPKMTAQVAAAAAEGDRSENAEYIYSKKKLREIDGRIRFLSALIDRLTVVEPRTHGDRIFFGAWVTIANEDGTQATYRLVGPDETDSKAGCISVDSPVGAVLLGKQVGDVVAVKRPRATEEIEIIAIRYGL